MNADEIVKTLQAQFDKMRGAYEVMSALAEVRKEEIESLQAQLAASQRRAQDARNELCQRCGRYKEAHKGACDGCRWKEDIRNAVVAGGTGVCGTRGKRPQMSELKEAITYFKQLLHRFEDAPNETYWGKEHNATTRKMIHVALDAMRRAQPENEPLTLSELYDIDSEPLYFHCMVGHWSLNGWHIVKAINYDGAQFKDVQLDNNDAHIESLYNYGITWLAYRTKPERSEG